MADYNIKGEMTLATGSFIASAKQASNSLNQLNTSAKKPESRIPTVASASSAFADFESNAVRSSGEKIFSPVSASNAVEITISG